MRGKKVRFDVLMLMLQYSLAPTPLNVTTSLTSRLSYRISDSKIIHPDANVLIYDMLVQEITYIDRGWESIIAEFEEQGDIYYRFTKDLPDFVKRVPHQLWFPKKKALLPPSEKNPEGLDGKGWARVFST